MARIAQGDLNTWFALHQLARGQDGLVALKQGRHLLEEVLEKNGDERAQPILIRNHLVEAFAGPDVAQAALTRARDLLDPAIAKAPRSYQYMNMDLETSRLELRLTLENGRQPRDPANPSLEPVRAPGAGSSHQCTPVAAGSILQLGRGPVARAGFRTTIGGGKGSGRPGQAR